MGIQTEPPQDPYYCSKCKNYFYHMATGIYFVACPDCDTDDADPNSQDSVGWGL
jgi:hypothetical protein